MCASPLPRLTGVPVKDLEACQRQLSDSKEACSSGPARELQKCRVLLEDAGKQGESERRRVLAKDAEFLRAGSELESCKRSGARCESEKGKLEDKLEKSREDEAACKRGTQAAKENALACKQHSETLQSGTPRCCLFLQHHAGAFLELRLQPPCTVLPPSLHCAGPFLALCWPLSCTVVWPPLHPYEEALEEGMEVNQEQCGDAVSPWHMGGVPL